MKKVSETRRVNAEEIKEGYEFEDKRRVRLTVSYVNADGSLEEIENTDCDGVFAMAFKGWDKEKGAHNGFRKIGAKVSELDLAQALLSDDRMNGVCGIIAVEHIAGGIIKRNAKKDE